MKWEFLKEGIQSQEGTKKLLINILSLLPVQGVQGADISSFLTGYVRTVDTIETDRFLR
jgi:hypothetical protein